MFTKVLIANRGVIACRIIRTLKRMGIQSVAVYSEADARSLHVQMADEAVCIGAASASESYLRGEHILGVALKTGAQAIHPGYGFLSENAAFAELCEKAGVVFIGPTAEQMRSFGLKHTARELAEKNGVPLLPGSGLLVDVGHAHAEATRIGYPVMIKSTAGGGGIGMRLCWSADELGEAYQSVDRLARANFKDAGIYLEKYVENARHIEVQLFGDGKGGVIDLGERDCSVQRRNQKVIEETPAPGLTPAVRKHLLDTAVKLGKAVNYQSAGTVEFVFDANKGEFYFLEVNTRLQVEHGVTEEVTGVDLVEWMVLQAAGELPALESIKVKPTGTSMQVRLYAEDTNKNFQPASGILSGVEFTRDARIETWVERGSDIPPYYDPMIAKIIVKADSRDEALKKMQHALATTRIDGIECNLEYLRQIVKDSVFTEGRQTTRYLNAFHYRPHTIDVIEPGVQSTIQDYPGRQGYWNIGVPPSGPMDTLAFRLANRLLANDAKAAALELTVSGPTLRFNSDTVIALTGAAMNAELDGSPLAFWRSHTVKAGSVLRLGVVQGSGCRAYLAVAGGFDVPEYLGSKSTFTLGQFGGHGGRTLRVGDVLHLDNPAQKIKVQTLPANLIPAYSEHWEIGVLYGPHGAPDFFTRQDIEKFFVTDWEVHYNSSRTGVRLIGPKPEWARQDGGEAGLHPSNIHDNAYAIGAVDFTGDMPVILGPDGPSLGGFVCPVTIAYGELWKLGQLKPGNTIRFKPMSLAQATFLERVQDATIAHLCVPKKIEQYPQAVAIGNPIIHTIPAHDKQVQVVYRQSGDRNLLIEYGPLVLDLNLRFRVHGLMQWLEQTIAAGKLPGIIDLAPGIRSLQIHFDSRVLSREALIYKLIAAEKKLPPVEDMQVPTRIVHLPLSWDDPSTKLAIEKYMHRGRGRRPHAGDGVERVPPAGLGEAQVADAGRRALRRPQRLGRAEGPRRGLHLHGHRAALVPDPAPLAEHQHQRRQLAVDHLEPHRNLRLGQHPVAGPRLGDGGGGDQIGHGGRVLHARQRLDQTRHARLGRQERDELVAELVERLDVGLQRLGAGGRVEVLHQLGAELPVGGALLQLLQQRHPAGAVEQHPPASVVVLLLADDDADPGHRQQLGPVGHGLGRVGDGRNRHHPVAGQRRLEERAVARLEDVEGSRGAGQQHDARQREDLEGGAGRSQHRLLDQRSGSLLVHVPTPGGSASAASQPLVVRRLDPHPVERPVDEEEHDGEEERR